MQTAASGLFLEITKGLEKLIYLLILQAFQMTKMKSKADIVAALALWDDTNAQMASLTPTSVRL